jgi:hypothetical protein
LDTPFSPTAPASYFYFFPTHKKIEVFNAYAHCTLSPLPTNAQAHPKAKPKECNRQRSVNTEQPKNKQPRKSGLFVSVGKSKKTKSHISISFV